MRHLGRAKLNSEAVDRFCFHEFITFFLHQWLFFSSMIDPHINDNVECSSSSVGLSSLSAVRSEREYCTGAPCRDPGHPARPAPPSFQSAPFSAPPSGSTPWNRKALPSDGARPALHSFIQHLFCGRPPWNRKKQKHPLPHSSRVCSLFFALSVITLYPSIWECFMY